MNVAELIVTVLGQVLLEQGAAQITIYPVQGLTPVQEWYGYDTIHSTSTALDLATSDTSTLVFHSFAGQLSMVVIQDRCDDGTGGEVLAFAGPLPTGTSLTVTDDPEGITDSWWWVGNTLGISWSWGGPVTDGLAVTWPDAEPFCVMLHQVFIDGISKYQVLSEEGPLITYPLSMSEPLRMCKDCAVIPVGNSLRGVRQGPLMTFNWSGLVPVGQWRIRADGNKWPIVLLDTVVEPSWSGPIDAFPLPVTYLQVKSVDCWGAEGP